MEALRDNAAVNRLKMIVNSLPKEYIVYKMANVIILKARENKYCNRRVFT